MAIVESVASFMNTQEACWVRKANHFRKFFLNISWVHKSETPYAELSEEDKASDRVWAWKVLKLVLEM